MNPTPLERILIGLAFAAVGFALLYGGVRMGAGSGLAVVGLCAMAGGLGFALYGLVLWIIQRIKA